LSLCVEGDMMAAARYVASSGWLSLWRLFRVQSENMKNSLPEQSEHVAERLAEITTVIRELVGNDLAMLILFGSYARGDWVADRYEEDGVIYTYESDFDLLAVTEDRAHATMKGEALLRHAVSRRLRRLGLDRPNTMVIAEDIEHFNKNLSRGNYFFTDIKKEGVLLFDNGRHTLVESSPVSPAEHQQYAREDFDYWFESASEFFDTTFDEIGKERFNKAAFELHQATERFFHAVVLTFTRYKPKTHDLEKLDRQASNLHADFFTVFPRATKQQQHCFDLLKEAYIGARYKRDYVITKEELEYLGVRVRKLQELTKRICEAKIAGMA
jgi:uncharacterized protein